MGAQTSPTLPYPHTPTLTVAVEPLPSSTPIKPPELTGLARVWADLVASGWHEAILRYASHGLLLVVLAAAIWARQLNLGFVEVLAAKASLQNTGSLLPAATPVPLPGSGDSNGFSGPPPAEPTLVVAGATDGQVARLADVHTLIPTRGRSDVVIYTVQPGDTLFGIAERYGLKPETVLWGNYFTLRDDPHSLVPGQALNILPVDGTYHYVTADNTLDLEKVAAFYQVDPQAILDWGPNGLDPNNPVLVPNTYLVVPGGQRELQSWVVPTITRDQVATAGTNFGQCPGGYSGAVGSGFFVWPANHHFLSGYDYTSIHRGLDIDTDLGDPIYAVDNGVVVYAGPNSRGYGNMVMIDHGNGWQSLYAHLSQWNVECGQSVFQTNLIGLSGSTGNSSGPHLHFELRFNGATVSPWTVLP
jgi:murein DD-endopeptidase MepM/ murein hydrolase activator NlpD